MAANPQKRRNLGFDSNLHRFKNDILKLTDDVEDDRGTTQKSSGIKSMTRKEKRKEHRKLKKMRRNAFYQHLPMPSKESLDAEKVAKLKAIEKKQKLREKRKRKRLRKLEEKRQQEEEEELKAQVIKEANKKDDRVIKELEKQLFIKKRKSKTKKLPQGFINDGLDYLLDVVDTDKLKTIFEEGVGDVSAGMLLSDEEYGMPEEEEDGQGSDSEDLGSEDQESVDESEDGSDEDESSIKRKKASKKSVRFQEEQNSEEKMSSATKGIKPNANTDKNIEESEDVESEDDIDESEDGSDEDESSIKRKKASKKSVRFQEEQNSEEKMSSATKGIKPNANTDKNIEESEDVESEDDIDEEDLESDEEDVESGDEDAELGEEDIRLEGDESDDGVVESDEDAASEEIAAGSEAEDESGDEEEMEADDVESEDDKSAKDDGDQDSDDGDDMTNKDNIKKSGKDSDLVEDIYGRLRDKDGKVVQSGAPKTGGYIPPGKRLALAQSGDEKKKLELERIRKQVKGLLNRLSEANLQSISNQVEEMFRQHSRAFLSETLTSQILEGCITPVLVPERLIMEQVALISILHVNVGTEIGATFLQETVNRFQDLLSNSPQYGESKEMNNLFVIVSHLYNFRVIQSPLVFDVFQKFVEGFGERDLELILLLLKNVGFSLRKDDPESLKNLLAKVKDKASSVDTSHFEDKSRVKFMLEVMMAIRNNNMRKIPNYDQSSMEHLRKMIRQYTTGGSSVDYQLRISLQDLLSSEEKGRWWLVGSAWSGTDVSKPMDDGDSERPLAVPSVSQKILDLAAKQRMNTDIRRNIFCVIMTSEDFVDAFEKLLRLGLKSTPEQEIIHVIMDLCMQESPFNPFYAYLAQKFCEYHRRFQMTVQFFTWDKLKLLYETPERNIVNLANFLTHLIAKGAMSLSLFKNVQFSELDKGVLLLMRTVLTHLLMDLDDLTVVEVFSRIARLSKLKPYHDGLKIFMQHFILRQKGKGAVNHELKQRVDLAERALNAGDASFKL